MLKKSAVPMLAACLMLLMTGCATRSISDSDREPAGAGYGYRSSSNPFYKGELSELSVLGIESGKSVSEVDIEAALAAKRKFAIPKGAALMLVQSGAMMPDEVMASAMEKYYKVTGFTGVPEKIYGNDNYSRMLRLAAARGGNDKMVVYWGLLESGQVNRASKVVSWLPFVGGLLSDETQRMRIRLKVAVVDVKTGQWEMFMPTPFEDTDTSGRYTRISADQAQVALLKGKGYPRGSRRAGQALRPVGSYGTENFRLKFRSDLEWRIQV
ncbi:MAG: aminopeptidase [Pseudomonadota bacterium]